METTTNYGLKKPAQEDFVNVEDINYNSDILDEKIAELEETAEGALPAEDYTAEDILNKLKTVDGAGSGLDADLFKGQSVVPVANGGTGAKNLDLFMVHREFLGPNSNVDTATQYGFYQVGGASGLPTNNYGVLLVTGGGSYYAQIYKCTNSTGKYSMWTRTKVDTSNWSDWRQLFDDNDVIPEANGGTGQTSLDDFAMTRSNIGGNDVAIDLNDYTADGFYYVASHGKDISNYPPSISASVAQHSILIVERAGNGSTMRQTYIPCNYQAYDGYAKNVYYRLKFGNNDFTDWFEYATENNMARMMNAAFASGAMTAITVASDTAYTTAKVRNIQASTTDLTAGTSALANGNIYLVYE